MPVHGRGHPAAATLIRTRVIVVGRCLAIAAAMAFEAFDAAVRSAAEFFPERPGAPGRYLDD